MTPDISLLNYGVSLSVSRRSLTVLIQNDPSFVNIILRLSLVFIFCYYTWVAMISSTLTRFQLPPLFSDGSLCSLPDNEIPVCPHAVICPNPVQWSHDGRDGVPDHQPHRGLLNRLLRRRPKKISKLRVTDLCAGNSPVTGEFPAKRASKAENVSICWRHYA